MNMAGRFRVVICKPLFMSNCTVVNKRKSAFDVYIGRGSKWGNPFTYKQTGTKAKFVVPDRETAVESYREWITQGEGRHLLDSLHELKGKVLGCYCKPKACHGDVLVDLVERHCQ